MISSAALPTNPSPRMRPAVDALAALPLKQLEKALLDFTEEEVNAAYAADPWLQNYVMSAWEKTHGKSIVKTYPWHQALAATDICNAKCPFCPGGFASKGVIDFETLAAVGKLMRFARTFILSGIGEPTVHPKFSEILEYMNQTLDPRCSTCLITNGDRILNFKEEFERYSMLFNVSVNAATPQTHHAIMGMGLDSLERVKQGVRFLRSLGRHVSLSFVVTRQNLVEIPAFINLCYEVDASLILFHTLNISSSFAQVIALTNSRESYHDLSPQTHPDFTVLQLAAVDAIKNSRVPVRAQPDQWNVLDESYQLLNDSDLRPQMMEALLAGKRYDGKANRVRTKGLPLSAELAGQDRGFDDLGDPFGRTAPFSCDYVYYASMLLNQDMQLGACCFMKRVPGFEEMGYMASENFFEIWNSPAMVTLRERLICGPLYPACKTCTYQLEY